MQFGLGVLKTRHPWPKTMPELHEDWHGWLCSETATALAETIGRNARLVVECGTWLGCSARAILSLAPEAHLVCIDHWLGSPEHQVEAGKSEWYGRLETLYAQCQRNLWTWRERVTLVRADSLAGLVEVYGCGLSPDTIYLDSKHTMERVAAELAVCRELFPQAAIVGDDYNNAAVALAVDEFARLRSGLKSYDAAFVFPRA